MPQSFSANLGFLWAELSLPDAIKAAASAGFDAVECHWPYDTEADAVLRALNETGLPILGLNTDRGPEGAFGLSALPGYEDEARAAIDQAIVYTAAVGAGSVHVMAGISRGNDAEATFLSNLDYACKRAAKRGLDILIEPINTKDVPGYFLTNAAQAVEIIERLGHPNLKLMFDCYHMQIMEGSVISRLRETLPLIGHIQFASVPDRGAPDGGDVDYAQVFNCLDDLGWTKPLGAEYKPNGPTDMSLGWLRSYRDTGQLKT